MEVGFAFSEVDLAYSVSLAAIGQVLHFGFHWMPWCSFWSVCVRVVFEALECVESSIPTHLVSLALSPRRPTSHLAPADNRRVGAQRSE